MLKTVKKQLKELFENDEQLFNSTIEELDSYNGYLSDDRYYEMEMLSDFFHGADPIDLLNRAYFGYDADNWHTDSHGNREHAAFNPNREYFTFNSYGNLVSTNYKDYSTHLDNYFIDSLIENYEYLYLEPEVLKIMENNMEVE
jgi:hypothetical protein